MTSDFRLHSPCRREPKGGRTCICTYVCVSVSVCICVQSSVPGKLEISCRQSLQPVGPAAGLCLSGSNFATGTLDVPRAPQPFHMPLQRTGNSLLVLFVDSADIGRDDLLPQVPLTLLVAHKVPMPPSSKLLKANFECTSNQIPADVIEATSVKYAATSWCLGWTLPRGKPLLQWWTG